MKGNKSSLLFVISALLVGGLIGAAVALLTAPQSGEDTRGMIRSKSMELRDKAVGTAQDTRDRASKAINDVAQQTKERASSITRRGHDMVQERIS